MLPHPQCDDCKHCFHNMPQDIEDMDLSLLEDAIEVCFHPKSITPNGLVGQLCETMRASGKGLCGPEAKLFEINGTW